MNHLKSIKRGGCVSFAVSVCFSLPGSILCLFGTNS